MGIINSDNLFGVSPYIVDPIQSNGSYTTIQSAINAVAATGAFGTIYIRPGSYIENLTLPLFVNLVGATNSNGIFNTFGSPVTIKGNHTCSGTGYLSFQNIGFVSAGGNIFTLATGANAATLIIDECYLDSSAFAGAQCISLGSGGGGGYHVAYVTNSQLKTGLSPAVFVDDISDLFMRDCIVSGTNNPIGFSSTGTLSEIIGTKITCGGGGSACVVIADAANVVSLENSELNGAIGVNFTSAGTLTSTGNKYNCTSFTTNYITGAAGTYNYADDQLVSSTVRNIAAGITATPLDWRPYATTTTVGTSKYTAAEFTVSSSGLVALVGGPTGITWVSTSVNIAVMTVQTGYFCVAPGGVLTLGLPAVSVLGDTIRVSLDGATSWTITQGAAQQILVGSTASTLGVAGSVTSTAQGDSVEIVCRVAGKLWVVQSLVGNLTIV